MGMGLSSERRQRRLDRAEERPEPQSTCDLVQDQLWEPLLPEELHTGRVRAPKSPLVNTVPPLQTADRQYMEGFNDELEAFKDRWQGRAGLVPL